MKWGMTPEQFSILNELVIAPLKKYNCTVYIFGSRALGKNHPYSDVDLLFRLAAETSLPAGYLSNIKENIEESRFPFLVDLVNEAELTDSYKESVFSSRVEL